MADGGHRGLDDKDIAASILGNFSEFFRMLGNRADDNGNLGLLDFTDPLGNQLFIDGLDVDLLDKLGCFLRRSFGDGEGQFLVLEYSGGDRLFVPVGQIDRVTPYIGSGEGPPG